MGEMRTVCTVFAGNYESERLFGRGRPRSKWENMDD
jgi:hypothetical protein